MHVCIVLANSRLEAKVYLDTPLGNDQDGVEHELVHGMEDIARSLEVSL